MEHQLEKETTETGLEGDENPILRAEEDGNPMLRAEEDGPNEPTDRGGSGVGAVQRKTLTSTVLSRTFAQAWMNLKRRREFRCAAMTDAG